MSDCQIICGDAIAVLKTLPSESVQCCVTSPPYYGLRDYGTAQWNGGDVECKHRSPTMRDGRNEDRPKLAGSEATNAYQLILAANAVCGKCGAARIDSQIGLEASPQKYIAKMVELFADVWRVLTPDGTLWLNLGDSYNAGTKGNSGAMRPEYKQSTNAGSLDTRRGSSLSPARNGGANSLCKPKDLMLMPARVAIALQEWGWYVRSDIPWVKRSAMPESVKDRPAKSLEYIYLLTKSEEYFCDMASVRITSTGQLPGNKNHRAATAYANGDEKHRTKAGLVAYAQKQRDRSLPQNRNGITGSLDDTPAGVRNFRNSDLWFQSIKEPHGLVGISDEFVGLDVNPGGFSEAHFATFPPKLIEPLIKAGSRPGDLILDPFTGAGTTALVALKHQRRFIGAELNPEYIKIAERRLQNIQVNLI